jgi:PKD repeat protein
MKAGFILNSKIKLVVCFFILTGTIRTIAQPLVANAGAAVTICSGSNTTIGGSPTGSYGTGPYTYSWAPSGTLSSSTTSNPTALPAITTTYTVVVTDAVLATATSTVTVTVNASPSVSANSPSMCVGSSVSIISSTSGGTTPYSYYWSPSSTLNSAFISNPVANPTTSTTYTLTVTDATGCIGTTTSTVFVNSLPNPIANSNSPVCPGNTLNLNANNIAGATYNWSGPNGFSASTQNPFISNVSSANAGTYTLTVTVNGCSNTATTNVIINSIPTVNAGPDQSVCFGNSVSFSGGGSGAVSYSWSFGDGSNSAVISPSHTYATSGIFTASLTGTGSNGCTATDMVQITVATSPGLTTSHTDATCNGACDGTASVSASGGFGPYTYFWSPGGATTSSVSGLCAGSYTVSVNNSVGCGSTAIVTISQPSALSVSTSSTNVSCNGMCNGTASVTVAGGVAPYTYSWIPGGQTTTTINSLCAGTYTVAVTDLNGCAVTGNVSVTEPTALVLSTGSNQMICAGDTTTLTGTVSGGASPYSFSWSNGGNSSIISVSPIITTSYTLNVIDNMGCVANPSTVTVIVSPLADITGQVSYSGGSLSSGVNTAVLYPTASFDTLMITTVDASGNYTFSSVAQGDYLVKIFADTTAYPALIPTYYGDAFLWDSATVITHACTATAANITMNESASLIGPGVISGVVVAGNGFVRVPGDPIPGVDIKLGRNPGGQLVTNTQTNTAGEYTFSGIPLSLPGEYYTIYVDIPGLDRDSTHSVVVTSASTTFSEMNYVADSTDVYPVLLSVGITNNLIETEFSVYPNPSKGNVVIDYILTNNSNISLGIYNTLGVLIAEPINNKQAAGIYKQIINIEDYKLNAGIYFIILVKDGKTSLQRLVITK